MELQQPQDWEGLRALWRVLKRLGAIVAMALVGAVFLGFGSAVITACAYCIGMYVGAPIGAGFGAWMGFRMAPRDVALVFVLTLCGAWAGVLVARQFTDESLIQAGVWGICYVLTALAAFGIGERVPVPIRRSAAIVATTGFAVFCSFWVIRSLWFVD